MSFLRLTGCGAVIRREVNMLLVADILDSLTWRVLIPAGDFLNFYCQARDAT